MSSELDSKYVGSTLQVLEKRCLNLLCEGYNEIVSQKKISADWDEEDISKELILCLAANPNRNEWKINIVPELRLYSRDTSSAKKAPRIDFYFACWAPQECKYFAEAKILIETDVHKTGRKSKTTAESLHKRYVKTGIDSYLSGKYPSNGCLIGYVLQGKTENIIGCLNRYLCTLNRVSEMLQRQSFGLKDFDECYISTRGNISIKHLMFNFVAEV